MKKVLITACNNARTTLWKPIIERIGADNIHVCTNTPELREMLNIRGIKQSNILSTENYFYDKSLREITKQAQNITKGIQHNSKTLKIITDEFGVFCHQACRLTIGAASTQELHTIFTQTVDYWIGQIKAKKITDIYFTQVPHTGGDYCLYVAAKTIEDLNIYSGHPIARSKIFIDSNPTKKAASRDESGREVKDLYLSKLLNEIVEKYEKRNTLTMKSLTQDRQIMEAKTNTVIKNNLMERRKIIIDESRPTNYFCMFLGSEPEAANNPNSKPILTSVQALLIVNAYIDDDSTLVLREHPHMLNGSKKYTWQEKDSYELARSSSFFGGIQNRENTYYAMPSIRVEQEFENCCGLISMGGDVTYEACALGIPVLDLSSFRKKAMLGYGNYYTLDNIQDFFINAKGSSKKRNCADELKNHLTGKTYFNTFVLRPAIEKGPKIQDEYADHCSAEDMIGKIFG